MIIWMCVFVKSCRHTFYLHFIMLLKFKIVHYNKTVFELSKMRWGEGDNQVIFPVKVHILTNRKVGRLRWGFYRLPASPPRQFEPCSKITCVST